ncbi:MAG TPA: tetratricopeptide repeat protein [Caldilineaceae bacterium]|nr:tetratricopeptide repeat protein [Caldilineaceae bacterium]
MYLDRTYRPRRRYRGIGRFWPLIILAVLGVILYEEQPTWLFPQEITPTPVPTRSAIFYQAEAEAAIRGGRYDDAFPAFEEMKRLEPDNPAAYVALSELYIIFRDIDEALRVAQEAVSVAPENADALVARARALNWQEDNDNAVIDALDALDIEPDHATAYAVLGEIYTDVGQWDIADGYLTQALTLEPENITALRNRAYYYERQGDYEDAVAGYEAAIAAAPYRFDLYIELGRQYSIGLGEFEKAVETYRKAVEVYEAPITLDALGEGLYNRGDHLQAVRELRRAVEMNDHYGPARVHLGMALFARRNFEDAALHLEIGLQLIGDQARVENLYTLGLAYIYKEPRECEKAIPWLQKALALSPENGPALDGLATCSSNP